MRNTPLLLLISILACACTDTVSVDCKGEFCASSVPAEPQFCAGEQHICRGNLSVVTCDGLEYQRDCAALGQICGDSGKCEPNPHPGTVSDDPTPKDPEQPTDPVETQDPVNPDPSDNTGETTDPTTPQPPKDNDKTEPEDKTDPEDKTEPEDKTDPEGKTDPEDKTDPEPPDDNKPKPTEDKPYCDEKDCYDCPPSAGDIFYICSPKEIATFRTHTEGAKTLVFVGEVTLCDDSSPCANWETLNLSQITRVTGFYNENTPVATLKIPNGASLNKPLFVQPEKDVQKIDLSQLKLENLSFNGNATGALFNSIKDAEIHDIEVDNLSLAANDQENVGGLIGIVDNATLTLNNITVHSIDIQGKSYVGGILGKVANSNLTMTSVENHFQSVKATLDYAGGVVGKIDEGSLELDNIKNEGGNVQADQYAAGFIAHLKGGQNIHSIRNTVQNVNAQKYAAGFVAFVGIDENTSYTKTATVNINNILNVVDLVHATESSAGGFIARLRHNPDFVTVTIDHIVSNAKSVTSKTWVGGFITIIHLINIPNRYHHTIRNVFSSSKVEYEIEYGGSSNTPSTGAGFIDRITMSGDSVAVEIENVVNDASVFNNNNDSASTVFLDHVDNKDNKQGCRPESLIEGNWCPDACTWNRSCQCNEDKCSPRHRCADVQTCLSIDAITLSDIYSVKDVDNKYICNHTVALSECSRKEGIRCGKDNDNNYINWIKELGPLVYDDPEYFFYCSSTVMSSYNPFIESKNVKSTFEAKGWNSSCQTINTELPDLPCPPLEL